MRKAEMKVVTDCKSIPGEATVTQHRILVMALRIRNLWKNKREAKNRKRQTAILQKKAFKEMNNNHSEEIKGRYRVAKRLAKREVAKAKKEAYKDWYDQLKTKEGDKTIYRIAKARSNDRRDAGTTVLIKDKNRNILMKDEEIKQRWKDYFTDLLNNENQYQRLEEVEPVEGPIPNIEMAEVKAAIKGSKSNKAGGRLECVEMMKTLGDFGIGWTFKLLESIWKTEEMPQDWKISEIVTIYKRKGDNSGCNSHRGIKLLEYMLKVIE
nr:uncharacterized protein LOC113828303 [Penaeus vannamei]